jgi:UDP-GlcNAc:undecaprenyl-phosphate GlcNAc-1-phosphate transferase
MIPVVIAASFGFSLLLPYCLAPMLRRMGVVDVPTWRSAHTSTTIRGGGLAPLLAIAAAYILLLFSSEVGVDAGSLAVVAAATAAAGVLGWVEDSRGLAVRTRAALQLVLGAAAASVLIAEDGSSWLWLPICALFIAAYVNVANFMDGINGLSALHGFVVGGSYAVFGIVLEIEWMAIAGAVLAVAFVAFLPWNFSGRMFLGDSGSYLLGGGISVIAVAAVVSGVPPLLVLAPLMVYLADSGITLMFRVIRGERWQEAHRSHVYQRLTDMGLSHLRVASIVSAATLLAALAGSLVLLGNLFWLLGVVLLLAVLGGYMLLPRVFSRARSSDGLGEPTA